MLLYPITTPSASPDGDVYRFVISAEKTISLRTTTAPRWAGALFSITLD